MGVVKHIGSVHAPHPAALGWILATPEIDRAPLLSLWRVEIKRTHLVQSRSPQILLGRMPSLFYKKFFLSAQFSLIHDISSVLLISLWMSPHHLGRTRLARSWCRGCREPCPLGWRLWKASRCWRRSTTRLASWMFKKAFLAFSLFLEFKQKAVFGNGIWKIFSEEVFILAHSILYIFYYLRTDFKVLIPHS